MTAIPDPLEAVKAAQARYAALPRIEQIRMDNEQRKSFVRGMIGRDPEPTPIDELLALIDVSALPAGDTGGLVRLRATLGGVGTDTAMQGDNLAILLASHFEPGIEDETLDDSGTWKQGAIDAADEILDAIHDHYANAIATLSRENAAKDAEIVGLREELRQERNKIEACRAFVERHPSLSLIDLAEFEAFLKVPAALDAAERAALSSKGGRDE